MSSRAQRGIPVERIPRCARDDMAAREWLVALRRLHRCGQRRNDLECVTDDAVVRDLEDRRFLVLVDRDDRARSTHACEMLDGARDANSDIELRAYLAPGLSDLVGV